MGLEHLIAKAKDKWLETTIKLSENPVYKYSTDVVSGWLYYTPTYALQELAAGKDAETIIKTRLIGMGAHVIAMRPVGIVRNYFAKKWNVTQDSPKIDKFKVNLIGVTPIQSIVYGGMLIGGMAWSGNWNWEASAYAWGMGVALGAAHSIPYGFVQDKVRKFFGVKPAIAQKEGMNIASEQRYISDNTPTNT